MDLENIVDAAAHKPAMGLTANMSKDVTKNQKIAAIRRKIRRIERYLTEITNRLKFDSTYFYK